MNTATTLGLLNLPQFYPTKQTNSSTNTSQINLNPITANSSILSTPDELNKKVTSSSVVTPQTLDTDNSQFQTPDQQHHVLLQNHYNLQNLPQQHNAATSQQHLVQQQKDLVAINLTRSLINNVCSTNQQTPLNVNNNNSHTINNHQQFQIQLNQQQPALIESLVQAVPTATSTPNPIQQHHHQQQDIFTNLLLKFDPTSFFPKKTTGEQLFNVSNLNSFNLSQINANSNINSNNKLTNHIMIDPKKILNHNQQQNIIVEQQIKASQIIHQQQQFNIQPMQQQHQSNFNNQNHHTMNNLAQQQLQNIQQNSQIQHQQLQQHHQMQLQHLQNGGNVHNGNKINEIKLNDSALSSDDDHNSSGGFGSERPYKCSQCFKTFRKKVHLNQHCRIHSGEKPYGCDFCEKRFTQLSHLWQHTRRHTGERPYKCEIGQCDKSFTQLSNLKSHIKTHGDKGASSLHSIPLNSTTTMSDIACHSSLNFSDKSFNSQMINNNDNLNNKQSVNRKLDRFKYQNRNNPDKPLNIASTSSFKNSTEKFLTHKRHYCEICHKRFATEGVIRQHLCSRQSNVSFVRNDEGSLILKPINSNTESNLNKKTN